MPFSTIGKFSSSQGSLENQLQDEGDSVCKAIGLSLSGPAALCGFKPLRSLSMPSAEMLMSGILGWGLDWNGWFTPESCRSSNGFWARA